MKKCYSHQPIYCFIFHLFLLVHIQAISNISICQIRLVYLFFSNIPYILPLVYMYYNHNDTHYNKKLPYFVEFALHYHMKSSPWGSLSIETVSYHYDDVIMTTMASQITSLTIVYSTVYSDADQRKHQSSASLAFVRGFHRDRWIPRTKGQLRGKCFHLMTSSCQCRNSHYKDKSVRPSDLQNGNTYTWKYCLYIETGSVSIATNTMTQNVLWWDMTLRKWKLYNW